MRKAKVSLKRRNLSIWISIFLWVYISININAQNFIHINQLGYFANGSKVAMLTDMDADTYTLRLARNNQVVFSGMANPQKTWNSSGENIQMIDFSEFKTPGKYYVQIGTERSYPFEIRQSGNYDSLAVWTMKAFYLWRASCPIEAKYATYMGVNYARQTGHPDTVVYIHKGVANEKRHIESEVNGTKGWYDASDYNKYVVNAGFSIQFIALLNELYPEYCKNLRLNIPETGNGVPDILNELKWELDWMLSMQDPTDGGVYFKLTTLAFSKMEMPSQDQDDRYMVGKSTSSALNFASSMAVAARLFAPYDSVFPNYSNKMLEAAKKAYEWAVIHPNSAFKNPEDVTTGEYGDNYFSDEFFLANVQLFISTGNKKYYDKIKFTQTYDSPTWHDENSLGLIEMAIHIDNLPQYVDKNQIGIKFKGLSESIYKQYYYNVGKVPIKKFEWGSNGVVATNGAIEGIAYKISGDTKFKEAAVASFDYLLGRNSLDYCFVTRFGTRYPHNIHDRRTQSDGITEPLPGYLVGGPNKDEMTDCGQTNYPSSIYPARAYLDDICSYSTNEIAINWNAPFVLLTGIIINENK